MPNLLELVAISIMNLGSGSSIPIVLYRLRLGAQSVTLLSALRDPTQLRRRQWPTRQQHPFFCYTLLSSLEHFWEVDHPLCDV
jgi:hypothetical protein